MQNLVWNDKTDKKSEIEAKDVNSLANAIITIIDWINQGGADVDLSEYVKNTDYATADKAGVVKVYATNNSKGIRIMEDGSLAICSATDNDIMDKANMNKPIVPGRLEYAVEVCTNQDMNSELTEQQQKLPPSTASVKAYIEDTLLGGAW